ncbi:MAG: type VI secretion system Vgr family protein, partial [Candidatus Polarisedimenticolia bacterium]
MTVAARALFMLFLAALAGGGAVAQEPVGTEAAGVLASARLSVSTPLGEGVLLLEGFRGQEAISSLFAFELDLLAPDGRDIPFEAVLGKEFRVTIALADGSTRHFSGICSRFARSDRGSLTRYEAGIVPRFWLLTRRQDSRIFQEKSVPQILAQVLGGIPDHGFELRLQGTFQPRDFVVQYGETDFAFVSRLMEDEGIFYFFRHGADGHTMVIANTPQDHPDLPVAVPYRRDTTIPRPGSIATWEKAQEVRSGKYTLRDYNFELPGQTLEESATIQQSVQVGPVVHSLGVAGNDQFEIYDYPGGYAQRFDGVDPAGGERPAELAKIFEDARRTAGLRMQEEATRSLSIRGTSTAPVLAAGHRFSLSMHPEAAGSYVLTSVRHAARAAAGGSLGVYGNAFTCIPAALPYRPPGTTPKPVIPGPQTAIVVGPPGEELFTDKYGRVKVQFHWDRQGQRDGSSSCWVRVASLHAGTESGFTAIPRIGWEVVVSFEDGDPDRPI